MVSIRHASPSSGAPLPLSDWDEEHTVTDLAITDVEGLEAALTAKQAILVSGTSIKTVNGESLLGSGNIVISGGGGSASWGAIGGTLSAQTDLQTALNARQPLSAVLTATTASFTTAQETKLAGIATGATANAADAALRDRSTHTGAQAISTVTGLQTALDGKQATLVSGTNIKTVNGTSVLGAGNIEIVLEPVVEFTDEAAFNAFTPASNQFAVLLNA